MLGRPAPAAFAQFLVVDMDNGVSLDFMEKTRPVAPQHYAFLVSEPEFDAVHDRIKAKGIDHWADPARTMPSAINHHFGGRGVYFADPLLFSAPDVSLAEAFAAADPYVVNGLVKSWRVRP